MLEKFASAQVVEILSDAAQTIRLLASERDEALHKVAEYETRDRATKLAQAMIDKGLTSDPFDVLRDNLEKKAEATPDAFADFERSVSLVAPDMGKKFGSVGSINDSGESGSGAVSQLESFLAGG